MIVRIRPVVSLVLAVLAFGGGAAFAEDTPAAGAAPSAADVEYKARFDAAIALHDRGQYEAAIAAFRDLLAGRPDDPTLLCEMANSLFAAGRPDEAVPHAERGLARPDSGHAFCSNILGSALDARGDFKKGEKVFRRAIKESPDVAILHFNLGVNQSQQNRIPEAIDEFKESLRLNPAHASSWRALAIAWQGQRLRPRAFAAFARFLTLEPTGNRAEYAARQLGSLLFQGVDNRGPDPETGKGRINITLDSSIGKTDKAAAALDLAMSTVAAGRWLDEWKDRTDAEYFAHAFETIMKIFEEVGAAHDDEDAFWRDAVLPYFRAARAAGHLETMGWDVRRVLPDHDIAAWLEAHAAEVEGCRAWSAAWKPAAPAAGASR